MSEPHDSPQGPVDPHGEGGMDAPPPPGGPQRSDSPDGPFGRPPGEHDDELPDESDGPYGTAAQRENAETSLDEPSDGSGSDGG